jgi:hypothetical protein
VGYRYRTLTEAGSFTSDGLGSPPFTAKRFRSLRWPTVRVLRYRQHKPNGVVIEACWLTDLPLQRISSRLPYGLAKSRWEIENVQ